MHRPDVLPAGPKRLESDAPEFVDLLAACTGASASADLHGVGVSRAELEAAFSRVAAIAEGRPARDDPLVARASRVGMLVVMRELAHHLDVIEVRRRPLR